MRVLSLDILTLRLALSGSSVYLTRRLGKERTGVAVLAPLKAAYRVAQTNWFPSA